MFTKPSNKGFTLIELIITISILAILVTVLVVAINPAEQLSRSRDAKRAADLDALKSAINLYVAQATSTINLDGNSTANATCVNHSSGTDSVYVNSTATLTTVATSAPSGITAAGLVASSGLKVATSTGPTQSWMPALLSQTPGGSPIATLPADPKGTADATYYYSYACDVGASGNLRNFELNADFESDYFQTDLDLDGTDGGQSAGKYEVGTDPGLDLL